MKRLNGAVALVFEVEALQPAGLGRNRRPHFADQLGRALVEADHRTRGIGGLAIEVEHVLHGGDIGGVDLGNAPHVPAPGLQRVLRQAPTHGLARQALMLGERDHDVGQQLERPARAARRRGRAGGGDQQRLLLAAQLALSAGARGLDQGEFQIAFHETPLGAIDRRAAGSHASRDLAVTDAVIGGKENLRALDFAHRMSAALQERRQLFTLVLAQFDTPAYVHQDFLLENYPDESKPGPLSRPSSAVLHRKAGPVSRLHSRLHGHQRKAARRSRHAAPLPGHAALRPPNGPDTRAPRPHRTTTRTSPIHPNPHRPRDAARHQINSRQTVITSVSNH